MDFDLSQEQQMLVDVADKFAKDFPREYMLKHFETRTFPQELWEAVGAEGYLGISIPTEFGGAGLGQMEMMLFHERLGEHGIALLSAVLGPGFTIPCIIKNGSNYLKETYVPDCVLGKKKFCFGITEPNAGTNTFNMETVAKQDGDDWVINGTKCFISMAKEADYMLLVCRTIARGDLSEADKRKGISLFVVETNTPGISFTKMEIDALPENQYFVFMDNVRVPARNMVGEEGNGGKMMFDALNAERIMVGAMSVGMGTFALNKAVAYANERKVFGVPIGSHQGLQHQLASAYAHLEVGKLMNRKAAWLYDRNAKDPEAGKCANIAKFVVADAGFEACDAALQAHGGYGFDKSYDLLGAYHICRLMKTAPINREMLLNYIGHYCMGLPASY